MLTSSWFLFEALQGVKVTGQGGAAEQACRTSNGCLSLVPCEWALGSLRAIQQAWILWKWEQAKEEEVCERRVVSEEID